MKKIIFAFTLLTIGFTAIAKPRNVDKNLLQHLSVMLKNSAEVKWTNTANFDRATFSLNSQSISAFYYPGSKELIGYFIYRENPVEITNSIQKKYSDYSIISMGKFIDASGSINYFAQVANKKNNLVLRITPNGKINIFSRG